MSEHAFCMLTRVVTRNRSISVPCGWGSFLFLHEKHVNEGGLKMKERLLELKKEALAKIDAASSLKELQDVRVAYLGKKGPITEVLRGMGKLPPEERPIIGQYANEVRNEIAEHIENKQAELKELEIQKRLEEETIDVTLPGRPVRMGNHHPLTAVIEEIEDLFIGMGYQIAEGPEV